MYVAAFFSNDPATTEIYTLSLHDALPIFEVKARQSIVAGYGVDAVDRRKKLQLISLTSAYLARHPHMGEVRHDILSRSEEHTSELQSQSNLVCRLLLEKKKKKKTKDTNIE